MGRHPSRVRIPPDLAPLLELYRDLGHAARKGLWLSEEHAKKQVQMAARVAARLSRVDEREG